MAQKRHRDHPGCEWDHFSIPTEPKDVRLCLMVSYYDDDGNESATEPYTIQIFLDYDAEGDTFSGTALECQHPIFSIPLDNHDHNMIFMITCFNGHPSIRQKTFLQRWVPKGYYKDKISKDNNSFCISLEDVQHADPVVFDANFYTKKIEHGRYRGGHTIDTISVCIRGEDVMGIIQTLQK